MQLQWSQFKNQVSDRGGDKDRWPFLIQYCDKGNISEASLTYIARL